jgi:triacylglycerol esterase/lipase EstA (alpha/beta hydrolase family)
MTRVAAHGHSMGAFVTVALLGAYPNDVRALPLMLQRVHDWYTAHGMF